MKNKSTDRVKKNLTKTGEYGASAKGRNLFQASWGGASCPLLYEQKDALCDVATCDWTRSRSIRGRLRAVEHARRRCPAAKLGKPLFIDRRGKLLQRLYRCLYKLTSSPSL